LILSMVTLWALLLSMVTFSGTPLTCMTLSKKRWLRSCRAYRSAISRPFCPACPPHGIRFLYVRAARSAVCHPATFRLAVAREALWLTSPSCRTSRGPSPPSKCALPDAPKKGPASSGPFQSINSSFVMAGRSLRPLPLRMDF
jgi:hypothetical protein